jgi:hypothetical protein
MLESKSLVKVLVAIDGSEASMRAAPITHLLLDLALLVANSPS